MEKEYSISKNTIEFTCLNVNIKEINEAFKRNKENALEIEDFYLYNIFTGISVKEKNTLFAIDGGVLAELQKKSKSKTLMEYILLMNENQCDVLKVVEVEDLKSLQELLECYNYKLEDLDNPCKRLQELLKCYNYKFVE